VSSPVSVELERAAAFLAARGVESARLEAEVLLADALGSDRGRLYLERAVSEAVRLRFAELLDRRGRREPLQHLRGRQEFFSRDFVVDPCVLIPRPETERLIETVLGLLRPIERPRILDVGTGSGVIAVTLALELPDARIFATEVSAAALDVAKENARRLGVGERIEFRSGDLVAPFAGERFDLVVSNPPYVPSEEIAGLSPEVRDHEPRVALDGGADGLEFYRRLAACVDGVLAERGWLAVEIGFGQGDAVRRIFSQSGAPAVEVERDLEGIERVVVVRRG
jgi:release factor glutamine methyltransferase